MSDAALTAAPAAGASAANALPANGILELRVSGHLMTLDTGLFCIFQPPGAPAAGRSGLPGIRISPSPAGREGAVRIATFAADGWLPGGDGAALVRVTQGPAQVLVTIYQAPDAAPAAAPRLQVLRLSADPAEAAAPVAAPAAAPEILAHIQRTGDVGAALGEWMGVRGSKLWIEGFSVTPADGAVLEYQAVLGRGWLSPWVEAGAFCGSRGMALPLLGLAARVKGDPTRECRVTASFGDGTLAEDVAEGTPAMADSLAPLEAFRITLHRRVAGAATDKPAAPRKTARRPR